MYVKLIVKSHTVKSQDPCIPAISPGRLCSAFQMLVSKMKRILKYFSRLKPMLKIFLWVFAI